MATSQITQQPSIEAKPLLQTPGSFYVNTNLFQGEYLPPNNHYESLLSTMVDQTIKGYQFTDENTPKTLTAAKWLYLCVMPQSHNRMTLVHAEPNSIFKFEDQLDLMKLVDKLLRNYFIASLLHSLGTVFLTQGGNQIPSQSHQQIVERVRERFGLPKVWELKEIKN